ncbi:putative leucine-rich repeat domain, L domain-containing protein [Rosa chinensis]|uniref:Putative leucine-rich repeat domain, L domain-containing protein n=1 Tax=Rosa chinensis TaxID=74649 RepID=A0A2P6SE07_ROSCH|nr:putative leucine-rich repeat domain, L domain-containing protein [Rosa chinensis]
MHDLINDLASFVFVEFCFRWEGSNSPNSLSKTSHFSDMPEYHYHDEADSVEIFEALQQDKCLRTFLLLEPRCLLNLNKGRCDILPKSQCLRVLNLYKYNIKELPDTINDLRRLRYLDLSWTPIKKLPDTICTLYNLQVLLLSNCRGLTELPANLGRLINLSHLDITETKLKKMPPQMGKLKDLQMLPEFVLDKHNAGENLAELKKLEKLRGRLCISGLVHSSGLEAYILRNKKFLKELVLDWRGRDLSEKGNNIVEEREVLEKLQPHLNLERLTIKGYGGKMFPGSEFYYGDGNTSTCVRKPFRCLQSLKFYSMSGWQEWSYVGGDYNEGGVFPNLVRLEVSGCPNLTGRLASEILTSLVCVSVSYCPEFECIPEGGFPSKVKIT